MTRRQALAACGAGIGAPFLMNPAHTLMRALVDGFISSAEAAGALTPPRTLINYHIYGAPVLWYSLLPMSPYANLTPTRGPHMNNSITNGALLYKTKAVATASGGTLYMPNLWASNVATPSGVAPMTNLIENMLIIRGFQGNSNESHAFGAKEMTRPVGTRPSLMGLVSDGSPLPVQSILTSNADGLNNAFKAERSGQTLVTNFSDPMTQILGPFDKRTDSLNSTFVTRRAAKDLLIQQALSSLGAYASSNAPGSESLFSMRGSAETFLKNGISAALAAYPVALAKYKKLISDCGSLTSLKIVGLTDNAIPLPTETTIGIPQTALSGANGSYTQNPDVGSIITSTAHPDQMAENFAIAEVLVSLNLSASICLGGGSMYGMNYVNPVKFTTKTAVNASGWWNSDEHSGGSFTSLIADSFMYQCLYSCINELITVLKAKNMFSETVIFVTSDFGRAEDPSDYGTKHASDACAFQIFSGAIAAPAVIGNISRGVSGGDHGQNRPVTGIFGSNRPLNVYDATSTVAGLARVTPPSDNNPSLVSATGVPLIELAREAA